MKKNYGLKGFAKKLAFLLLSLAAGFSFAQNIGDYGAITNGNWTGAIWGTWNGTSFVGPATTLPATTKDVYIPAGITVSTPSTSTTVNIGNLNISGTLTLNSNFTLGTNTKKLNITGGTVLWNVNANFTLSDPNAIVNVTSGSPGFQGGSVCNNNRAVVIGTVRYAVCSGSGNADYLFSDINLAGGTIASVPAISPSQICQGSSTTLSGSAVGLGSGTATFRWSVVSSPSGYVFPSGFSTTSSAPQSIVLSTPGTYVFSLQVSTTGSSGTIYSNTQNVTVIVNPVSVGGTASANQTICSGTQPSSLTLAGSTGNIQWQGSTDNINFTNITGATSTTLPGTTIGNLSSTTYFRAMVTSATCSPAYSNVVTVTVQNPTISGPNSVVIANTIALTGSPAPAATGAWTSSNTSIATVSSTGVVTGVSLGTTTITYKTANGCTVTKLITVTLSICYENPTPATPAAPAKDSNFGITNLGRAGADNGNWPMVRKGAYMVVEAKTKGFVITRVANTAAILDPVEGMIVYNDSQDCLSIFDGVSWKCYLTQTCP